MGTILWLASLAAAATVWPTLANVSADVTKVIQDAEVLKYSDPLQALEVLRSAATAVKAARNTPAADTIALFTALGDMQVYMHRPGDALLAHQSARVAIDKSDFSSRVSSHASMATDLRMLQRYADALHEVREAEELAKTRPAVLASLLHLESVILECSGDEGMALLRFEAARKLRPMNTYVCEANACCCCRCC